MNIVYQTSKSNTPTLSTATTALASNTARLGWAIQNQATGVLYVALGAGATTGAYHLALKPSTAAADGTGDKFVQSDGAVYTGIITVAAAGTPSYTVLEMAP